MHFRANSKKTQSLGKNGSTQKCLDKRLSNQKSLFNNEDSKNSTELSKYVWLLRENNKIPSIKWKIVKVVYSKATSFFCKLCLTEKLFILNALGDDRCLNKKNRIY